MSNTTTLTTVDSTPIERQSGNRVQPTLPVVVNDQLVRMSENGNTHYTKGVVLSEHIKQYSDEYNDGRDEYEQLVDSLLEEQGVTLVEETLFRDVELSDFGDMSDMNTAVFLVETLDEQLPQRGKSQLFIEAVEYYLKTPFRDRLHRINVKREILDYKRGEIEQEELSELATEWIDVEFVPETDDSQEDSDSEESTYRYETLEEYRESADQVKETAQARIQYLQEYIDLYAEVNSHTDEGYPKEQDHTAQIALNIFECSNPSAERYAEGVQIRTEKIEQEKEEAWTDSDHVQKAIDEAVESGEKTRWNFVEPEKMAERIDEFAVDGVYMVRETVEYKTDTKTKWKLVYDPDSEDVGTVVEEHTDATLSF